MKVLFLIRFGMCVKWLSPLFPPPSGKLGERPCLHSALQKRLDAGLDCFVGWKTGVVGVGAEQGKSATYPNTEGKP